MNFRFLMYIYTSILNIQPNPILLGFGVAFQRTQPPAPAASVVGVRSFFYFRQLPLLFDLKRLQVHLASFLLALSHLSLATAPNLAVFNPSPLLSLRISTWALDSVIYAR